MTGAGYSTSGSRPSPSSSAVTRPASACAGIHAMAGLADDWEENRQTCIDVICAYLRMPYASEPPARR